MSTLSAAHPAVNTLPIVIRPKAPNRRAKMLRPESSWMKAHIALERAVRLVEKVQAEHGDTELVLNLVETAACLFEGSTPLKGCGPY